MDFFQEGGGGHIAETDDDITCPFLYCFSQVGIIMYLPVDLDAKSHEQRGDITESFMQYRALCAEKVRD